MSYPPELLQVAKRVAWFDPPEETLRRPRLFLAHLMNFGTEEDLRIARNSFPEEAFKDVLDHPPAGVFTRTSWERWNRLYGRIPLPPLPKRFPESPDMEEMLWGKSK
jgi:hypothetical protein